jgi:hypothetical protein
VGLGRGVVIIVVAVMLRLARAAVHHLEHGAAAGTEEPDH